MYFSFMAKGGGTGGKPGPTANTPNQPFRAD